MPVLIHTLLYSPTLLPHACVHLYHPLVLICTPPPAMPAHTPHACPCSFVPPSSYHPLHTLSIPLPIHTPTVCTPPLPSWVFVHSYTCQTHLHLCSLCTLPLTWARLGLGRTHLYSHVLVCAHMHPVWVRSAQVVCTFVLVWARLGLGHACLCTCVDLVWVRLAQWVVYG